LLSLVSGDDRVYTQQDSISTQKPELKISDEPNSHHDAIRVYRQEERRDKADRKQFYADSTPLFRT
jgi:hypothetical protein